MLLLLDTASMYFRAFYGVKDRLSAPDGTPVNAVRGLLDAIARILQQHPATHVVCCWDNDWRPDWRVELIPTYKGHRVATGEAEEIPEDLRVQIPIIEDVLAAWGVAVRGVDGYEADDVIGTLATDAQMPVRIVTGDRDLFQLVDDERDVKILYTARKGIEVTDNAAIEEKYGIRAAQYAAFATMRGDASDGLPGVPGVGEKTAANLLQSFGDLDSIIAAAADPASEMAPGPRTKITAALEYLDVAPAVVAVARGLDVDRTGIELPDTPTDPHTWETLTQRWALGRSAERFSDAVAYSLSTSAE